MSYYYPMGLALSARNKATSVITGGGVLTTGTRPRGGGTTDPIASLPTPQYKYVSRRGKKMDAEYLIFKVPPWTELQVAKNVSRLERELGMQAADDQWKKRDEGKSDVPPGTIVMQRYVPKNSMTIGKVDPAELARNPPQHIYNRRQGKEKDADFLQFRAPPWTDELIKQTPWDEWARRVGIPVGGRGEWFKREKSDVPAGYIVYQSYTNKRISPEGGEQSGNQAYDTQGNPLGPQAPTYTQTNPMFPGVSNTVLYLGAAGAALVVGLLLTKKKK